jgi:hypothetical protein
MRTIPRLIALSCVVLLGCSPPPPPAPAPAAAAPPFNTVLNLKQVMEWVIDPAADVIWDSVKTISTEAGTKEIAPQNDEQWAAVRNAAATLTEEANVLMIAGRARDQKEWMAYARTLTKTADSALKAAEAKNKDAIFTAGGEIYTVCRGCHMEYAKHLTSSTPPVQLALVSDRREWAHWPK